MEQNAMEVVDDNVSDEKADVEMEHQYEKDNECKEENQGLNEFTEKCHGTKGQPLEINEYNNFDKNNINIETSKKLKNLNNENNEYVSSADLMQSQQIQSGPSYENTSGTGIFLESNDFICHGLEAEQNFEFPFKQTEDFDLSYNETNLFSPSLSDSLCTDSVSCSLYSTSLSNPSSISHFSCLPGTSNEHSEYSLTNEEDLLFSYLEKMSNDNLEPISEPTEIIKTKDVENFETLSLEKKKLTECNLLQYVLENVKHEDNNEVQTNSECFVDDKIIINPEIMYNIELKLHLNKMQLLAEQVSKTPDDLTVLNKCMELMSIPKKKNGRQIITEKCRPFTEDFSDPNYYNIEHKDWNKIIVSQAAVLSNVGFDFASKDTLYRIRDEAINYTKKLAGIMKKNFDIQSNSSSPSSIDPIQKSLQEMGVKDGMAEMIQHYENDVIDRRNMLLKEYEHFQSTINRFVKCSLITPTVKNNYDTQEFFTKEQSTSKINFTEENVLTEEKASTSTEYGHINNIDTVSEISEYIKTNTVDIDDRKMYNTKCSNTDIKLNDLLKCSHMITVPSNSKLNTFTSKNSFLGTNYFCKPQNEESFNLQKNEKLFDVPKSYNIFDATKNNINIDMSKFQSTSTFKKSVPNSVKSIGLDHASFQKIIDEFNENFDPKSVYDNCSPLQNQTVNNNPNMDDAMNCENYPDYPSSESE